VRRNSPARVCQLSRRDRNRVEDRGRTSVIYIEDVRNENPLQFRVVGFARGTLTSYIVESRQDEIGEYAWVVTAWRSTAQEERAYEQATRGY
jgi:hypothetical protein